MGAAPGRKRSLRALEAPVTQLQPVPPAVSTDFLLTFHPTILTGMLSWASKPGYRSFRAHHPREVTLSIPVSYFKIIPFPFSACSPVSFNCLEYSLSWSPAGLHVRWQGCTPVTLPRLYTLTQTKQSSVMTQWEKCFSFLDEAKPYRCISLKRTSHDLPTFYTFLNFILFYKNNSTLKKILHLIPNSRR